MRRTVLSSVLCALAAAGAPAPAEAKDFCLQIGKGTFVLEAFKLPGKGKCRQLGGWIRNAQDMITGTACTFSDGTSVRIAFQTTPVLDADFGSSFGCRSTSPR